MTLAYDFLEKLSSEKITVRVGTGHKSRDYHVPKDLICEQSEWFKSALKPETFQEGQTKPITLSDEHLWIFRMVLAYIYRGAVQFDGIARSADDQEDHMIEACVLWVFADKYFFPGIQNQTVPRICQLLGHGIFEPEVSARALATCFQTELSPILRRLITDKVVVSMSEGRYSTIEAEFAGCDGFLECLHNSMRAQRNLAADGRFPRYLKPAKLKNDLAKRAPVMYGFNFATYWDFSVLLQRVWILVGKH